MKESPVPMQTTNVPPTNISLEGENNLIDRERAFLINELEEAHRMNRALLRQLKKAQEAVDEAVRAHAKMVITLTETMRENTALTLERDRWKHRAERCALEGETPGSIGVIEGIGHITQAEARAIRKAMARLHHPDSGGDNERMKVWNMILDRIENHE